MTKYPQVEQAFEYTRNSYADAGGMPAVLKAIQLGAVKAIAELVDRPDDEKDALMAASSLIFSKDMTVYKEAPENISNYSAQVQQIVTDAAARAGQPDIYTQSRDLMQIGLSHAVGGRDIALSAYNGLKDQIDEIAESDPRLLGTMLRNFQKAVADQAPLEQFFTGEQPRLEAAVKDLSNDVKALTDDITKYIQQSMVAAEKPTTPAQKRGGKNFDL